jgi:hypothetical protein
MNRMLKLFGIAVCALICVRAAANPLNLVPPTDAPDFGVSSVSVTYTASTDSFQAQGYVTGYANGSVSLVTWGSFLMSAMISDAGVLGIGSLTIEGDIGNGVETLLAGDLQTGSSGTAFGSLEPLGGSLFEFQFVVSGGNSSVMQDFGGLNIGRGGIIFDAWFENGGVPFLGSWTSDFHNDGVSGTAEAFKSVPEPGSILLLLAGIAAIATHRKTTKEPGK